MCLVVHVLVKQYLEGFQFYKIREGAALEYFIKLKTREILFN